MAAETTTVRINRKTKQQLDEISSELGESLTATLETVVRDYRRRMWLEAVAIGYQSMRNSPVDWEDEVEDRMQWDKTIADGLTGEQ